MLEFIEKYFKYILLLFLELLLEKPRKESQQVNMAVELLIIFLLGIVVHIQLIHLTLDHLINVNTYNNLLVSFVLAFDFQNTCKEVIEKVMTIIYFLHEEQHEVKSVLQRFLFQTNMILNKQFLFSSVIVLLNIKKESRQDLIEQLPNMLNILLPTSQQPDHLWLEVGLQQQRLHQ